MGGGRTRIADPNWPEGYLIPYGVMQNNKMGELAGRAAAAWGLAGCQSTSGEQLHCASLTWYIYFIIINYYYYYYPFLFFTIKLSLSQPKSFKFF